MISTEINSTYIENKTVQGALETSWTEANQTTLNITPNEIIVDGTSTTTALITSTLVQTGDEIILINPDNTFNEIIVGTVNLISTAPDVYSVVISQANAPIKAFFNDKVEVHIDIEDTEQKVMNKIDNYITIDPSTATDGSNIVSSTKLVEGNRIVVDGVDASGGPVVYTSSLYFQTLPNHNLTSTPKRAYLIGGETLNFKSSTPTNFVGSHLESSLITTGDDIELDNIISTSTSVTETTILGDVTNTLKSQNLNKTGTVVDLPGWITETSVLPTNLYNYESVLTTKRLYILGGHTGLAGSDKIYSCPVNSDGTIGAFVTETNVLPTTLYYTSCIVLSNIVYLIGGYTNNWSNAIYSCPIASDGTLGAWSIETNTLPAGAYGTAFYTKNYVYFLSAGSSGDASNPVYRALIASDGTMGAWITDGTAPGSFTQSSALVTKTMVHIIGSSDSGNSNSTSVTSAPIAADGTIGAWSVASNVLPITTFYRNNVIATSNKVFCIAGGNIVVTDINADDSLSTWTVAPSTPNLSYFKTKQFVTPNYIYVIGGIDYNGSATHNTLQRCPFPDGWKIYSNDQYVEKTYEYDISFPTRTTPIAAQIPNKSTKLNIISKIFDGTKFVVTYSNYLKIGKVIQRRIVCEKIGTTVTEALITQMRKQP